MGFANAVGRCYANMFKFSGRARRAEYWWFFLFQMLVWTGVQIALGATMSQSMLDNPDFLAALGDPGKLEMWLLQNPQLLQYVGIGAIVWLVLLGIPQLTVTVRRLHDTNRSGWMIFMPTLVGIVSGAAGGFLMGMAAATGSSAGAVVAVVAIIVVPLAASIWFLVVLCLPGTEGDNRFGPDSIPDREPSHPAFAKAQTGEARDRSEVARKAAAHDYYKRRVLTSIHRAEET